MSSIDEVCIWHKAMSAQGQLALTHIPLLGFYLPIYISVGLDGHPTHYGMALP